jgi:4-hydroxy-3-methylbut-2-en-1-yl diphosphate reductase
MTTGQVVLAEPRGFCAGVSRAVQIVEAALHRHGAPVYVRKEIVHNQRVVEELRSRGAVFVDSEEQVPEGAVCVFSAHGVAPDVRHRAAARQLQVIDATCPLVARVHQEARRFAGQGRVVVLVGHADHEEVEGTAGEVPDRTFVVDSPQAVRALPLGPDTAVACLTQTTLSFDDTVETVRALRDRFTDVAGPGADDICYASQNRQTAVKALAARCDLVLVIGATNSSNSVRMVEVARAAGTRAELVPDPADLDAALLRGVRTVGVSSGASAPEVLVDQLLGRLVELGFGDVQTIRTATEDTVFLPPRGVSPTLETTKESP